MSLTNTYNLRSIAKSSKALRVQLSFGNSNDVTVAKQSNVLNKADVSEAKVTEMFNKVTDLEHKLCILQHKFDCHQGETDAKSFLMSERCNDLFTDIVSVDDSLEDIKGVSVQMVNLENRVNDMHSRIIGVTDAQNTTIHGFKIKQRVMEHNLQRQLDMLQKQINSLSRAEEIQAKMHSAMCDNMTNFPTQFTTMQGRFDNMQV